MESGLRVGLEGRLEVGLEGGSATIVTNVATGHDSEHLVRVRVGSSQGEGEGEGEGLIFG